MTTTLSMSAASASIFTRLGSMLPWNWAGRRQPGTQQSSAGSGGTSSGNNVDLTTALSVSAVWSSLRLISESVGSLPLRCYKVDASGKRTPFPDHPLAQLFAGKPNRYQTRNEFFETVGFEEGAHGNAYCLIQRAPDGRIVGLMPLMADQMTVTQDPRTGDLTYRYSEGSNVTVFAESSIWHVKGVGNGITGLSPLSFAREAIGLGLAGDRRAAKVAKNGFKPTGVIKFDKALKPEQREAIRQEFRDLSEGDDDTVRVLEFGMTYEQVSLSPADAQMLESRRFQLTDIARFFAVPAVMIGGEGTTVWGSGVESIMDGWYRTSLRARLERIECSINTRLLTAAERGSVVFEFDLEALLRMSPGARSARVKEHVQGGIMTPNEGRIEMGYLPHPDPNANHLFMQQQMVKLGTGGGGAAPPTAVKGE